MCNTIIINNVENEISTPRQFYQFFGFLPYNTGDLDLCLCGCDIENTFIDNNVVFYEDCGDFYVKI